MRATELRVWIFVALVLLTSIAYAYRPQGGSGTATPQSAFQTSGAYGTADSNDRMIAVTGVDLTGSSILYVIDTQARQLAVYQANGGGSATQNVKLVGARRIDLDLQLYGYKDESEHSYEALEKKFVDSGLLAPVK
jgi:hypothetical protein